MPEPIENALCLADPADAASIAEIRNHYIANTVLTFAEEPLSVDDCLRWHNTFQASRLPLIVAHDPADRRKVFGYCCVAPYHERAGYRWTVELSLYCHPSHVGKGTGSKLLRKMLEILREPEGSKSWFPGGELPRFLPKVLMLRMAIDIDGVGQGFGLRDYYLRYGFAQCGHQRKIGWKKDRWVDVLFMQMAINQD